MKPWGYYSFGARVSVKAKSHVDVSSKKPQGGIVFHAGIGNVKQELLIKL